MAFNDKQALKKIEILRNKLNKIEEFTEQYTMVLDLPDGTQFTLTAQMKALIETKILALIDDMDAQLLILRGTIT